MLSPTVRIIVGAIAVVLLLSGLFYAQIAGPPAIWSSVVGAALLIALVVERNRYRSEAADRSFESIGPGGGEPRGPVEARFRPTEETFVDPPSGLQMRVFVDPRTGERRYVAEG